jgi:hypothetical protein
MTAWRFVSASVGLLVLSWVAPSPARAQASWLDEPLANWNVPGMEFPSTTFEPLVNPRCLEAARWAETPLDLALVEAGWSLFSPYRAGWGIMLVDGASGYDGMCRPMGYQSFVFVDGVFAGTIAPIPMDSRASGAGTVLSLRGDVLTARFVRYQPTDPLCCPSLGAVVVEYRVERTPDGPLLVPFRTFEEPPPGA